jgi:hypothetical protein
MRSTIRGAGIGGSSRSRFHEKHRIVRFFLGKRSLRVLRFASCEAVMDRAGIGGSSRSLGRILAPATRLLPSRRRVVIGAVFIFALIASRGHAAAPSYERDITPILRTYCSGCHNDREQEGEFSVETFASLRKGGAGSGDPVVPGDAAASVMIQRIHSQDGDHMPPDDEPQVPSAELAVLMAWIGGGGASSAT